MARDPVASPAEPGFLEASGMRVLLAVHAYPPRSTAGVEIHTQRLAEALADLGHEVSVLAAAHDLSRRTGSVRRYRERAVDVVEVVNLHSRGTLEDTYRDPDVDRSCREVMREIAPDVVHVQHLLNLSTGILAEARRLGAALLLTLHDYWLSCPRDGLRWRADGKLCTSVDHGVCAACLETSPYLVPGAQRSLMALARRLGLGSSLHRLHATIPRASSAALGWLRGLSPKTPYALVAQLDERRAHLRRALADVDLALAPTEFARDRGVELGLDPGKVRVVRLGVKIDPDGQRRAKPPRRFGYVGTIAPHKGVHVLVEAFRRIAQPSLSLDVHGSLGAHPDYAARLRGHAEGDDRVTFRGAFHEGEQARVLAGLDVLVLPSLWWENSPLTLLEARGAGVAIVASRTGGIPELLPEGAGRLVPPGDVESLRVTLEELLGERSVSAATAPPRTVAEEARELEALYASLRGAAIPAASGSMAS